MAVHDAACVPPPPGGARSGRQRVRERSDRLEALLEIQVGLRGDAKRSEATGAEALRSDSHRQDPFAGVATDREIGGFALIHLFRKKGEIAPPSPASGHPAWLSRQPVE